MRLLRTLNSNLILLIRPHHSQVTLHLLHFKFQSDSINTNSAKASLDNLLTFKFQSDSINTATRSGVIKNASAFFKFQSDSINTGYGSGTDVDEIRFKFQSDSINTCLISVIGFFQISFKFQSDSINTLMKLQFQYPHRPLNSNLILLIRKRIFDRKYVC